MELEYGLEDAIQAKTSNGKRFVNDPFGGPKKALNNRFYLQNCGYIRIIFSHLHTMRGEKMPIPSPRL